MFAARNQSAMSFSTVRRLRVVMLALKRGLARSLATGVSVLLPRGHYQYSTAFPACRRSTAGSIVPACAINSSSTLGSELKTT